MIKVVFALINDDESENLLAAKEFANAKSIHDIEVSQYVFDELDRHNILPGKFYTNKMDPISIDNITKDSVTISYFDNDYDIRDSREIELPIKVFLDDAELLRRRNSDRNWNNKNENTANILD